MKILYFITLYHKQQHDKNWVMYLFLDVLETIENVSPVTFRLKTSCFSSFL